MEAAFSIHTASSTPASSPLELDDQIRRLKRAKARLKRKLHLKRYIINAEKWILTIIDCFRFRRTELLLPQFYPCAPKVVQVGSRFLLIYDGTVQETTIDRETNNVKIEDMTLVPRPRDDFSTTDNAVTPTLYLIGPDICDKYMLDTAKWQVLPQLEKRVATPYLVVVAGRYLYACDNELVTWALDMSDEETGWNATGLTRLDDMANERKMWYVDRVAVCMSTEAKYVFFGQERTSSPTDRMCAPYADFRGGSYICGRVAYKGRIVMAASDFGSMCVMDERTKTPTSVDKYKVKRLL